MIRLLIISLVFLLSYSCQSSKKSNAKFNNLVNDKLGETYQCYFNTDSTLALCKTEVDRKNPGLKHLMFVVVKLQDNTIVYQDKLQYGEVNWVDNDEIVVEKGLGYLNEDNAREKYIIDLKTLERRPVSKNYKKN